jgi:hypothetical protein
MKRLFCLIVTVIMVASFLVPVNTLADDGFTLIATPVAKENYIHLEWTDLGPGYLYTVYAKGQDEAVFQSIPSKTDVKVLNVYPNAGSELKTWMETNGYGKGLIAVDQVNILDFNNDPGTYLKDDDGNWKYDVIYFGAYDRNNDKDLTEQSRDLVEEFIISGRGVLFGHDTITGRFNHPNFNLLKDYVNVNITNYTSFGTTSVNVKREGLLTNYPWLIGGQGTVLNIPLCHSYGNFAMGDIWMDYPYDSWSNNANPLTELDGKAGTTNFYLTTWNNCAMIQTGHSNGAATEDEQKLLANTLFYLAQLTSDNFCDDHKSQDFAAPDSVNISSVSINGGNLVVNYSESKDNGTEYEFYVKATIENEGEEIISNTAKAINTTGLAGYSYIIDNNEDTEPDKEVDTTDTSISVPLSELDLTEPIYVHIKALDYAGNASETTHYEYTFKDKLK